MPTLQLNAEQIYTLVDALDVESKTILFERLRPQVISTRWQELFERIDQRVKTNSIRDDDLAREIEDAREEFYAHRR